MSYLTFIRANLPFLATGFLLNLLSSFGQTYFISIFGGEIRGEFGLSHGDWGILYMLATLASAALMVWAGGLADRFRVRVLGVAVLVGLALGCAAMGLNTTALGLALIIFALRFCGQGMASHLATVAMARWFVATRGRALAIAGMGFLFGEATMPLFIVWLKELVDWRLLWLVFGGMSLAMIPLLVRLLRLERTPEAEAETSEAMGLMGRHWTRGEALAHPLFWLLAPALVFFSAFGTTFWFHQVHYAEIKGWSHLALVAVFPLGTVTLAASTIFYGWAIDRWGAARLLPLYILPYAVAFVLHWHAPNLIWVAAGVILMGLSGGGHATIISACWAEFYGTRYIGAIKAIAAALMVFGSAIGPGLSGWLIDRGVAYEGQLLGFAASFVLAAIMAHFASRMAARLAVPA